jgi:hypothetical protein
MRALHILGEMATLALATTARRAYVFTASHLSHLLYLLRKAVRRILWAWPCAPGPGNNEVLHLRWLNKALTRVGLQGGGSQVVAADLVPLSENPWGMVGSIRRFRLTYNGVGTPGPASLVLKVGGEPRVRARACCADGLFVCHKAAVSRAPRALLGGTPAVSPSDCISPLLLLIALQTSGPSARERRFVMWGGQVWVVYRLCNDEVLARTPHPTPTPFRHARCSLLGPLAPCFHTG